MFTRLISAGVLTLALGVLINHCEADPISDESTDVLKLLGEWLVKQPDRPGSKASPGNSTADNIRFVKKVVDSERFKEGGDEQLKHPEVWQLLGAISRLDPDAACTIENLRATRDLWSILKHGKIDSEILNMGGPLTASFPALLEYSYAIQDCYTEFDSAWTTNEGTKYDVDPCLSTIKTMLYFGKGSPAPFPYRIKHVGADLGYREKNFGTVEQFGRALEMKRRLNRGEDPFSRSEICRVLLMDHDRPSCKPDLAIDVKSHEMDLTNETSALREIEAYLIKPCARLVSEKAEKLEPVVLLGSFVSLAAFVNGGPMDVLDSATIYLSCQVLLEMKGKDKLSSLFRTPRKSIPDNRVLDLI